MKRNLGLIHRNNKGEVHLGANNGKIAVWLDEEDAVDMANHYGPYDGFSEELEYAVTIAYPKDDDDSDS